MAECPSDESCILVIAYGIIAPDSLGPHTYPHLAYYVNGAPAVSAVVGTTMFITTPSQHDLLAVYLNH